MTLIRVEGASYVSKIKKLNGQFCQLLSQYPPRLHIIAPKITCGTIPKIKYLAGSGGMAVARFRTRNSSPFSAFHP